jgi:hypothetical protein
MSEDIVDIPFIKKTSSARKPMLSHIVSGKFIYNLYSDENCLRLSKDTNQISTNIGIYVPKSVEIHLKSNFIESTNNLTLNNGLTELKSGFHNDICFRISNGMKLESIKKDDFLGAFICNKRVKFEEFSLKGKVFINFYLGVFYLTLFKTHNF